MKKLIILCLFLCAFLAFGEEGIIETDSCSIKYYQKEARDHMVYTVTAKEDIKRKFITLYFYAGEEQIASQVLTFGNLDKDESKKFTVIFYHDLSKITKVKIEGD